MKKKITGWIIAGVALCLVLVIVLTFAFRSFWLVEEDGQWYIQFSNQKPAESALECVTDYAQEWDSVLGFQCAMAAGIVEPQYRDSLASAPGITGKTGKHPIFNVFELDNINVGEETELTAICYLDYNASIAMTYDIAVESVGAKGCTVRLPHSKESGEKWIEQYLDSEPSKSHLGPQPDAKTYYWQDYYNNEWHDCKEIRNRIKHGGDEYYVQQLYHTAKDLLPYTINVYYRSNTYDCVFAYTITGIEQIPKTEWITSFSYEPS